MTLTVNNLHHTDLHVSLIYDSRFDFFLFETCFNFLLTNTGCRVLLRSRMRLLTALTETDSTEIEVVSMRAHKWRTLKYGGSSSEYDTYFLFLLTPGETWNFQPVLLGQTIQDSTIISNISISSLVLTLTIRRQILSKLLWHMMGMLLGLFPRSQWVPVT